MGSSVVGRWLVWFPVVALVIAFGVLNAPSVAAPFGDSHDGRNGAMWATGSREIREVGPVQSRLGAVHDAELVYANHPPLIYLETAVVESILGERRWATRAPAWVGSLVSIGLMLALLRRLGFSPVVASAAVVVGCSSTMFLFYGSMLDTMVVALPLGLAYLLQVLRRPSGHWSIGCLAALACLASWQSFVLVGVTGVAVVLRDRRSWAVVAWSLAGAVAAGLSVVAWQVWSLGSMRSVIDIALARSGLDDDAFSGRSSFTGMVRRQTEWLGELLSPVALVAALAGAAAARRHRAGWLLLVGSLVVFGYSALMSAGAYFHDYWQYWILLPVVVACAISFERLPVREGMLVAVAIGALAAGILVTPRTAAYAIRRNGIAAAEVAQHPDFAGQPRLLVGELLSAPLRWVSYELDRPAGDVGVRGTGDDTWLDYRWRVAGMADAVAVLAARGSYVLAVEPREPGPTTRIGGP